MMSLSGNITCFAESLEYFPAPPKIRMRDRAHKRPGELRAQPIGDVRCPSTTVVDSMQAGLIRAFDTGSTWPGIDVVFVTGTNAAGVQCRAIRATAFR